MTKIALCFYGLNRSLELTYHSINERILTQLKNNNIEYDIYFYTFKLNNKINEWTKVIDKENENNNLIVEKFIKPKFNYCENDDEHRKNAIKYFNNYVKKQKSIMKMEKRNKPKKLKKLKKLNKVKNSEYYVVSSYLKYTNIKLLLNKIKHINQYSQVILTRPDLYFLTDFNIDMLNKCNSKTVVIPDFHHWGGVNDRFIIGTCENLIKINDYCFNIKEINPHLKLKKSLGILKLNSIFINFYFVRIRPDLSLARADNWNLNNSEKCTEIIFSDKDKEILLSKEKKEKLLIKVNVLV